MIAIDKLTKRFDGRTVLDAVTVRFARGKVSAIVGASGCGKSTLLRCINGLETFDEGSIRVGDLAVTAATLQRIRLQVGMVFQHYGLFSHMSALANVMEAPVHVRGLAKKEARARAVALLEKVGLSHRREAFPRELSGGEQQRVAIARALAMDPAALLLDEPTAALDPERKAEVVKVLESLAKEGTTMVIVTHEPAVVRGIADVAIVLKNGHLVARGAPAEVLGDGPAAH
ncbi:MAG: amino acid transporter, ATP-binding protein [Myxococcaceae bacterium]|nr:amino acid transporter, ATP-binding protein [Myxococcaceae bacterium]